ncbi:hypothetical protein H0E84_00895 [Luteimonas sp. SJ-92]|uniref:Uncharacterized protein n=1 Tax=Luteimonas salinisoli TaxID=2752307 RepID=A0A853J836_9GAMM|nr:hypothetical protein [Luteimonas salinisoli]NZA24932.1 hypothetical protein [Luteimonas salinisoli]
MLELGRLVMWAAAVVAGLGVLVNTMPWLAWRRDGIAMPPGTEARWLAFALALGAAMAALHWIRGMERARNAEELRAVRGGRAFEAQAGMGWFLLMVPLAALFAFGAWAAAYKGDWGLALGSLGLLALIVLLGGEIVRQVLRPGPMLRMDDHGIDHALYGAIPWSEVVGMDLQVFRSRYSTHHTLMLGVRGAARYLRNAPPLTRWLKSRRARGGGVGALALPLDFLAKDAELVYEAARALRTRLDAPFLEHWSSRMDAREVETLLRMRNLAEESGRIVEELRALPAEDDPASLAELDLRLRAHHDRHAAAMPEIRMVMEKRAQRMKRDTRVAWILLAVLIVAIVLPLALRLLK